MAEKKTKQQYFTIAEAGRLIKGRKLSPVELTRMCLSRVEEVDERVHAFITVTGDMALKEARRAEKEVMAGEYRGGMHGIPVGYKDLYMTKGVLTTCHSKVLEEWVPEEDATAVSRLREAGAVMVGKHSLSEFAFGGTNFKLPFAQPRNPWDTDYSPGGSSNGTAIAIATGMCLGGMGSDTGGSIRVPSSHVGVVGLKPTFGRVSVRGMVPLSWSLDNAGPMAWTAEDVAIMLQSVAGYDAGDPNSAKAPVPDYLQWIDDGVKGLTLGVCDAFMDPKVISADTLKAVDTASTIRYICIYMPCMQP